MILKVLVHTANCFLEELYKCPLPLNYISRDGSSLHLTTEGEGVFSILMFLVEGALLGQEGHIPKMMLRIGHMLPEPPLETRNLVL